MKLHLNRTSPYARLVRVILLETGLAGRTELLFTDPWSSPEALLAVNPASKVPVLELDDGTCLVESGCIADYLIAVSGQAALSPSSRERPAERLRLLGLGRAVMDCAFGAVIQQRCAPGSALGARWQAALPRIAVALEQLPFPDDGSPVCDLADLTVVVGFEYTDFRLPDIEWRTLAPRLAERVDLVGEKPSLRATRC